MALNRSQTLAQLKTLNDNENDELKTAEGKIAEADLQRKELATDIMQDFTNPKIFAFSKVFKFSAKSPVYDNFCGTEGSLTRFWSQQLETRGRPYFVMESVAD